MSRLTTCFVEQVGDGNSTGLLSVQLTPVVVVGLGSGVAMVDLGDVRRCFDVAAWIFVVLASGC